MAGFGGSFSQAYSKSRQRSSSTDRVFGSDFFSSLFKEGFDVAGGIDTAGLTETANQLFASGRGFLDTQQEIASGQDVSGQFLADRISGGSGLVDENIAALGEDLSQFFGEELMPQISSTAVGGGQLGGGRQGVAEGKALEATGREFRRGSLDIRNEDLRARQAAASQLSQQRLSASQAGLTGAQQQFDLATGATMAPFSPLLALSQIMGAPTVLTDAKSKGVSRSFSHSGSFNVGGSGGQ